MQAFTLTTSGRRSSRHRRGRRRPDAKYIAGGTDLLQLTKDNVETPTRLVDLEPLGMAGIHAGARRAASGTAGAHERCRGASRVVQALAGAVAGAAGIGVAADAQHGRPSAATCCSARAAAISATLVSPATNASPAPAVRRSTARTGCWRSSASATSALPPIRPTWRSR